MMKTLQSLALPLIAAMLASCGPSGTATGPTQPSTTADQTATAPDGTATAVQVTLQSQGLSSEAINREADPCQDFYEYACGGWLAATEIPADRAMWGRFGEIYQRNQTELRRILEQEATTESKVGAYYASCMDEASIEALGTKPIQPLLSRIRKLRKPNEITDIVAEMHSYGSPVLWVHDIDGDFKDATLTITHMYQSGLGLPDRDYYLKEGDETKQRLAFYQGHVERTLALAGFSPKAAKRGAADVLWLETELAKISKTRVEMAEIDGTYNRVDLDGIEKLAPHIDWKEYFTKLGVPELTTISVTSKEFFEGADVLVTKAGIRRWRAYLAWHAIRDAREALPKAFREERFALTQKLTGQQEQQPRWKRCAADTTESLRDLVAQEFIKTMFGGQAKQAAEMMANAITAAFLEALQSYDWLDDTTRAKAQAKASSMTFLIGYPDTWLQHEIPIDAKNYYANRLATSELDQARRFSKVGQPVDRREWHWSAALVNAFYSPLRNQMIFPAGILQPPFYDVNASVAVNLGAMGMIVGHEMTHGFDDSGAKFAGSGNREDWWSPEVAKTFQQKQQCVIDKYNNYEVLPELRVNGQLTLGENIADMGGVKLAFMAYRQLRAEATPTVADNYTEDQQFFLAVGQAWCTKAREEAIRERIITDTHSPAKFRVNGSLSSLPAFAEAFSCGEGTPMNPENMCSIW